MKNIVFITLLIFTSYNLYAESKWELVDSLWVKIPPIDGKERWGSVSWQSVKSPNKKDIIASAKVYDSYPRVFISNDTGKTWRVSLSEEKIYEVANWGHQVSSIWYPFAYSSEKLIIVGCDSGYYWKSSNNGNSFELMQFPPKKGFSKVMFWDDDIGVINPTEEGNLIDKNNVLYSVISLYRTDDGGKNWNPLNLPEFKYSKHPIWQLHILPDYSIYIQEYANYYIYDSIANDYYSNIYQDSCNYYYQSSNFGETWARFKGSKDNYFDSFSYTFYSINQGFRYGGKNLGGINSNYSQIIEKTTNGGRSWRRVLDTVAGPYRIHEISFADSLVGIASAFQQIFWTFNGGETWVRDTSFHPWGYDKEIDHILCIDKYTAIGLSKNQSNYVYRFTADHPVSVKEDRNSILYLFPNPVTTFLSLSEIPDGSYSYEIFDILGFKRSDGKIEKEINVEFLSKGIYFLKLNNQVKPIKFVKL